MVMTGLMTMTFLIAGAIWLVLLKAIMDGKKIQDRGLDEKPLGFE